MKHSSPKKKWFKRILALVGILCAGVILLLNFMAYNHAYHMLHFAPPDTPLPRFGEMSKGEILKIILFGFDIPKPSLEAAPEDLNLKYETIRIPGGDGIELETWYVPVQDATSIALLFHGYANEKSSLLGEAAAFKDIGLSSLLVDFRGSGGSNRFETTVGYTEAEDVLAAYDYAKENLPEPDILFYGQSMGSATILRAMAIYDLNPKAVILESVFDSLLTTVRNRFSPIGWPSYPLAYLFVFWGGYQGDFPSFKHNPVEYATKVQCPTLMLHGTEDKNATFNQAQTVFDNLNGRKKLEPFEGLRHGSLIKVDPEHWKRAVEAFLQSGEE